MGLLQLFPPDAAGRALPLRGCYLSLALHRLAAAGEMVIYSNFITSLDGRIALATAAGDYAVPSSIANGRDWRLYQELAAQADVMITSARYFRQLATGRAQDLLPVGREAAYADLTDWRAANGLRPQPDVAILSNSLDIPETALDQLGDRRVVVCCGAGVDERRVARLERRGVRLCVVGREAVEGAALKQSLIEAGYRSAYMIAGPAVHRTLLVAGVLDMLFLTTRLRLLGQNDFHTFLAGEMAPVTLELARLLLDQQAGQMFAQYRVSRAAA